jgi:hypothetical protein
MTTLTLQDLRKHGAKAIPKNVAYLIVNSETKAVLVPPDEYLLLQSALEELEDRTLIAERKEDELLTIEDIF